MPLIIDNCFTRDSYVLRSARLSLLSSHIGSYAVELDLPIDLITWAGDAFGAWNDVRVSADSEHGEAGVAFENYQRALGELCNNYQRVKDLLSAMIVGTENSNEIAVQYGINGWTPKDFHTLYERCRLIKTTTDLLRAEGDPRVLSAAIVDHLAGAADAVGLLWQDAYTERRESQSLYSELHDRYDEDSRRLRILYDYCTLRWGKESPNLIDLGFAVVDRRSGGQPGQPVNFALFYDAPVLSLRWDDVKGATSYRLTYSIDQGDWQKLYEGSHNGYSYDLPVGLRYYRVCARNLHGFGEWSEVIFYEL